MSFTSLLRAGRGPVWDCYLLAYVEPHDDERAETVTPRLTKALDWFATNGITTRRPMSSNAFTYTRTPSLRELLAAQEIKHLRTKPYRPQTNGKVERFHQTMAREWAYGLSYRSHRHRNQALPHCGRHHTVPLASSYAPWQFVSIGSWGVLRPLRCPGFVGDAGVRLPGSC